MQKTSVTVHAYEVDENGVLPEGGAVCKDVGVNSIGTHEASVRLNQTVTTMNNGRLRKESRVAFLRGPIEDMQAYFTKHGQVVKGNIQRTLSDEPFWEGQTPVVNRQTGEDMGYYHKYELVEDLNAPLTKDLRGQNVGVESEAEEVAD